MPHDDSHPDRLQTAAPLDTLFTDGAPVDEQDDLPETPRGSRKRARMACVQALYQWLLAAADAGDIIRQFAHGGRLARADQVVCEQALRGGVTDRAGLDVIFDAHLDRPVVQLDPVEHAILLLATYELRDRPEIPHAAVINEACDMARIYGAQDGYRFINAVLDATARDLRPHEK